MRWIFICSSLFLTSCLYVEGQVIDMPEDVVVGDLTRFAYWERHATVDVTAADIKPPQTSCESKAK